jgi:hypothetical protein
MAVSLAFGVLFATAITLLLVPVLYAIYQDAKVGLAKLVGREEKVRTGIDGGGRAAPPEGA